MQRYGFASAPISNGGYMSISLSVDNAHNHSHLTKNLKTVYISMAAPFPPVPDQCVV